jgi:hypothetical protein
MLRCAQHDNSSMPALPRYRIALVFPFGVTLATSPGCHPIHCAQGKL